MTIKIILCFFKLPFFIFSYIIITFIQFATFDLLLFPFNEKIGNDPSRVMTCVFREQLFQLTFADVFAVENLNQPGEIIFNEFVYAVCKLMNKLAFFRVKQTEFVRQSMYDFTIWFHLLLFRELDTLFEKFIPSFFDTFQRSFYINIRSYSF